MRPQERPSRVLRALSLLARNRLVQRLGPILRDLSEPSRTGVCYDENSTTTLSHSATLTDPQNSFIMVPMSLLLALGGYAATRLPMSDASMAPWKKRFRERALDRLVKHVAVASLGTIGWLAAVGMRESGVRVLHIDQHESLEAVASELGYLVLLGDSDSDVLRGAGLASARALVATREELDRKRPLPWTAYALNAQLEIVATSQNDPQVARLPRAGATEVVIVLNLVSALVGRLGRTPYA